MTIRSTAIVNTAPPGDPESYRHTVLDVPAGKQYAITTLMVCNKYNLNAANPENETESFNMFMSATGNSASIDTNIVVSQLSLPAGETFTFDTERVVLDEFDSIIIDGAVNSSETGEGNLVVTVSYLEI